MVTTKPSISWANLPKELLSLIAERLTTRFDINRFRAVCTSWRYSILPFNNESLPILSQRLPYPINPINPLINPKRRSYFCLTERTVYHLEPLDNSFSSSSSSSSSKGWLIMVEEQDHGKVRLLNPLSGRHRIKSRRPMVLNLSDFQVTELHKSYALMYIKLCNTRIANLNDLIYPFRVYDTVISSNRIGDYTDFMVAVIQDSKLFVLKLGDDYWTLLDNDNELYYQDITNYKGQIIAIDYMGGAFRVDSSFQVTEIVPGTFDYGLKNLVESVGDLYLIHRNIDAYEDEEYDDQSTGCVVTSKGTYDMEVQFNVYKLNEEEHRWVEVTSLGDQVFFLGIDCCYAVSAREFPGWVRNCIFFADQYCLLHDDDYSDCYDAIRGNGALEPGVFDLKDGTLGPLAYHPGYAHTFWPPPDWFKRPPSSSC